MVDNMESNTVRIYWFNLALTGTSSCLSIFGGAVIVFTYFRIKEIRNFTRTLLLYLTIADLLTASGNLVATIRYVVVHDSHGEEENWTTNCSRVVHVVRHHNVCTGQSFVTTFSNMASFFWTLFIATHIWVSVVTKSRKTEVTCTHVIFHVISWGVPLSIVTYFLVEGYLGEDTCYGTGVWCGIRSGLPRELVRQLMFLGDIGWQLFCYIVSTFFYMFIKLKLWLKMKYGTTVEFKNLTENLRNDDKNFLFVVLVIYSLKCWGIIRFFITSYTSDETIAVDSSLRTFLTVLLFFQSFGASGQAFANFILFCVMDKEVRARMKEILGCRRDEEFELIKNESSRETERMIVDKKRSVNSYDSYV